jgi:CheY-like chemotaxis protein
MSTTVTRDTVLVIDDDPYLRELVEIVGVTCGVPVLQAPDCEAGLKVLESENGRIKMILLDYFMPGMQPVDCACAITGKAGRIPVVLVTAAVDPSERAAELNIDRWLAKPFDVLTLTDLLTETVLTGEPRK